MATLNITSSVLGFNDVLSSTNNPTQKTVDWKREILQLPVSSSSSEVLNIAPFNSSVIFSGTVVTSIDNTTEFKLELSPLDSNLYRITSTSGTSPEFRTDRALALSGSSVVFTLNSNLTVSVTYTPLAGSLFSSVEVGDIVLVPGAKTGDAASSFNPLNEGYWTVLSADGTTMTLTRREGEVFEGASETVAISSDTEFQAYSSDGINIGDTVDIVDGFSINSQKSYRVLSVTPKWIEVQSTVPLAEETGVLPGVSGMLFYTFAKKFIRIESDQECVVKVNGDTTASNRLTPWLPGDSTLVATYERSGPTFQLVIENRASVSANLVIITAE